MKAALLICDHVPEFAQKKFGTYYDMYSALLPDIDLEPWHVVDGQFPEVESYDNFIISGSKYSVYDEIDWINDLKKFVQSISKNSKKLIGICFGHQMIAEALGGKVMKSKDGFLIGLHKFRFTNPQWMGIESQTFKVVMLCQDQVRKLPPNAEVLATSDKCPVGMFIIGTNILGIQGHPEFSVEFNQIIFESRRKRIGEEKINAAIKSFSDNPDKEFLSSLLMRFLAN